MKLVHVWQMFWWLAVPWMAGGAAHAVPCAEASSVHCDASSQKPVWLSAPEPDPPAELPLAEAAVKPTGLRQTITLPSGAKITLQEGWRPMHRFARDICTITLDGVTFDTLGRGWFEAYDYRGLKEAGALPPDGNAPRVGLIYHASSPNTNFDMAIVLVRRENR